MACTLKPEDIAEHRGKHVPRSWGRHVFSGLRRANEASGRGTESYPEWLSRGGLCPVWRALEDVCGKETLRSFVWSCQRAATNSITISFPQTLL